MLADQGAPKPIDLDPVEVEDGRRVAADDVGLGEQPTGFVTSIEDGSIALPNQNSIEVLRAAPMD